MTESHRGGAREGSGRPKGVKTKCYTVTLPLDVAEDLEKRAAEVNKTVSRYLRDIIEASGQYSNVNLGGKYIDDDIKPYETGSRKDKAE